MNRKFRSNIVLMGLVVCMGLFTGCSNKQSEAVSGVQQEGQMVEENASSTGRQIETSSISEVVSYEEDDYYTAWQDTVTATITLKEEGISAEGEGVKIAGNTLTIEKAGTYVLSGTLADGSIIVDATDKGTVRLVLNGVDLSCNDSAPVYVKQASKVVLSLEEGTTNRFADGENYILEDLANDEPNATIYSKDDLTINGKGNLEVIGRYNNAITSKDTLRIMEGSVKIEAADDGIMGKDAVMIKHADIQITAQGDGIKATNDTDETKGFIAIEEGEFDIVAAADGIQAKTNIYIADGTYNIETGGGSANAVQKQNTLQMGKGQGRNSTPTQQDVSTQEAVATTTEEESTSYKGIKAGKAIYIYGGNIDLDTADDSIHSNDTIAISGGEITIASGDDGVHADTQIDLSEVKLDITKSYEGIESTQINITSGIISVVASDDGINISGGNDSSALNGRPGQNQFTSSEGGKLTISGGTIFVDASGDGLDSNGSIEMTGGTVVVNGPTNDGNGALDYDVSFNISGGVFIAAGSAGMAQAPSNTSTQASIAMTYSSNKVAGECIHLQDSNGNTILTFAPTKAYRSVVISTPELKAGESYNLYSGGSIVGDAINGLYEDTATYTPVEEAVNFEIADQVTYLSESGVTTGGTSFGPGGNAGGGKGERPNKGTATEGSMPEGNTPPEIPDESNRPTLPDGVVPTEGQNPNDQNGELATPPEQSAGSSNVEGSIPTEKPTRTEKNSDMTPPTKVPGENTGEGVQKGNKGEMPTALPNETTTTQ